MESSECIDTKRSIIAQKSELRLYEPSQHKFYCFYTNITYFVCLGKRRIFEFSTRSSVEARKIDAKAGDNKERDE